MKNDSISRYPCHENIGRFPPGRRKHLSAAIIDPLITNRPYRRINGKLTGMGIVPRRRGRQTPGLVWPNRFPIRYNAVLYWFPVSFLMLKLSSESATDW